SDSPCFRADIATSENLATYFKANYPLFKPDSSSRSGYSKRRAKLIDEADKELEHPH
ncbi:hypothetical protein BHM03_00053390, partial [Ensete ventricosum]